MIKNIIFDFGKVLVDYDFDRFFAMLRDENPHHEAFDEFMRLVLDSNTYQALDKGERPFAEYVAMYKQQYPHCADLIDAFDTRFQEIVTNEIPDMRSVLLALKQRGYRVLGLSNWSTKVYDTMQRFEIFDLIEDRVLSCEEHLLKPDAAIYRRALERFGIEADETVFVDDRKENAEGAEAVGIHGITFTGAAPLRQELAALGVEI